MADLGSLTARIGLDTTGLAAGVAVARGELAALNTSGSNSLRALQTVGAAAFLGLAAAAGIVGTASVLAAADFESAMLRVRTQAGASQGEVDLMTEAILRMATGLGTSPNALADALFRIESTGIRGAEALELLELAAMGAQVGAADLTEVTMGLLAIINSHIEGVGSQSDAMGILNGIVGISNVTMGELAHALGTGVLPAAAAAGVSIQELGAAFGVLTSTGLPAEVAANRLRTTIALMSAPTIDAQKAFEELGLGSFELAETLQRDGLIAAIELLKTSLENSGLTATEQADIIRRAFGGGEMSSTILTLLGNFDMLVAKEGELGAGAQNFADSWEATKETFAFQMDQMKAAVEVLAIRLGTVLIPVVTRVAEALADATTWLMEHKDVALLLAGVIGGPLLAAMTAFAVSTLVAAAPIIAVGVAIGALTAGVIYAYQNFEPFRDAVDATGRFLRDTLLPALQDAAAAIMEFGRDAAPVAQDVFGEMVNAGQAVVNFFRDQIIPAVQTVAAVLMEFGRDAVPVVVNAFDTVVGAVQAVVSALMEFGRDAASVVAAAIDAIAAAFNAIAEQIDHFIGFFQEIAPQVEEAFGHVVNVVSDIVGRIVSVIELGLTPIVAAFRLNLAAVSAFWDQWGSDIIGAVRAVVDLIVSVFSIAFSTLVDVVTIIFRTIADTVNANLDIIANIIRFVLAVINGEWGDAWNALLGILRGVWDGIFAFVTGAISLLGAIMQGAWDAIVAGGSLVIGWFANLPDLIIGLLSGMAGRMVQVGVDIIGGIWNGIQAAWSLVWGWITNLGGLILNAFAGAGTWLWNVGLDLIIGLLSGLQSAWELIPGFIRDHLGPVTTAFEGLEAVISRLEGARISVNTELTGADLNEVATQVERIVLLLQEMSNLGGGGGFIPPPGYTGATGGIVPGPMGEPVMALLHGGERVMTRSQQRAQDLLGAAPTGGSTAAPVAQSSTTQYILQGDIVANDPAELERQLAARARLSNLTSAA